MNERTNEEVEAKETKKNVCVTSTGGLRVECSPATRAIRVRVSASAKLFPSFSFPFFPRKIQVQTHSNPFKHVFPKAQYL